MLGDSSGEQCLQRVQELTSARLTILGESVFRWQLLMVREPLLMCALTPNLFVLPSSGAEAEAPLSDHKTGSSLGPGLPAIDTGVMFDVDDRIPSGASLLGHFLQQMTAQV
jgi:hypothetical protein